MAHLTFSELEREPASGLLFRKACNTPNPKARLLLLHGVGSNETNLASIAASLPEGIEVLLLRGPLQIGPQGFAWYQVNFTSNGPLFSYRIASAEVAYRSQSAPRSACPVRRTRPDRSYQLIGIAFTA